MKKRDLHSLPHSAMIVWVLAWFFISLSTFADIIPDYNIQSVATDAPRYQLTETASYRVAGEGIAPETLDQFAAMMEAAHTRVARHFPNPMYGSFDVFIDRTGDRFGPDTPFIPSETPAFVSRSNPPALVINARVFFQRPEFQQRQTLQHELLHIFSALHAPVPLPIWLEEGIAGVASGEYRGHLPTMALRYYVGSLFRLEELQGRFPYKGDARSLAYEQSAAVVVYLIDEHFPLTQLQGFLGWLFDPNEGADRIKRLDDPLYLRAIDNSWRHSLRWERAIFAILLQPTYLLGLAGLVAIPGLIWVRYRRRRMMERMELTSDDGVGEIEEVSASEVRGEDDSENQTA